MVLITILMAQAQNTSTPRPSSAHPMSRKPSRAKEKAVAVATIMKKDATMVRRRPLGAAEEAAEELLYWD